MTDTKTTPTSQGESCSSKSCCPCHAIANFFKKLFGCKKDSTKSCCCESKKEEASK